MTPQRLGVCYYPEHWPESLWREDARRMRELGLTYVRIGEFAWSRLEPSENRYDFGWLDRAFDVLDREGLKIVLGTPTATPPRWLVNKMPDMVALDAAGRPRKFGSRRHYCFSHAPYAEACERIVAALAQRYGAHPALAAWQTDNEYGCHDTVESYSASAASAFRSWCEKKYGTIDALNRAWGNVFWSMELASFADVEPPNLTVTEANPAHRLDFRRFSSDRVAAFNRRQVAIIRRFSPDRPILHNFMGAFTAFDHYRVGKDLDAAAWDSYPLGFLERSRRSEADKLRHMRTGDPDFQSFHHDLYRSCGRGRFWIMEQQPGAVNWGEWNPAPADGAVRLWSHEAFAAGAEVVSYFRWRQAPFAQEQMHEGLLLPNSAPNAAFEEVRRVASELQTLGAAVETERSDVALVFDYESAWAWEIQPQGRDFSYEELVMDFYRGLRRAGLSIDVVPPTAEAVRERKLVLAPGLFCADPDLVTELENGGAVVLLGPRSGARTGDFQIPAQLPPGELRRLAKVAVERVESLRPGVSIAIPDGRGAFERWREKIAADEGARVELTTTDGQAALTRNRDCLYLAGWPDPVLCDDVLERCLAAAGMKRLSLRDDIRVRDAGARRYVFNYGPDPVDIRDIAGDADLLLGGHVLAPCGVAVFSLEKLRATG